MCAYRARPGAVLELDADTLAEVVRTHTADLLDLLAADDDKEASPALIDWPTTAVLALRRALAVPTGLPTCPVEFVVPDWVE